MGWLGKALKSVGAKGILGLAPILVDAGLEIYKATRQSDNTHSHFTDPRSGIEYSTEEIVKLLRSLEKLSIDHGRMIEKLSEHSIRLSNEMMHIQKRLAVAIVLAVTSSILAIVLLLLIILS